jgi:hypothetical protein
VDLGSFFREMAVKPAALQASAAGVYLPMFHKGAIPSFHFSNIPSFQSIVSVAN